MGAALTILGAIELNSGEIRAAREMYARAADKLAPWRRHAGWQWLMVAELSDELDDPHRADREMAKAASSFRPNQRRHRRSSAGRSARTRPGSDLETLRR